MSKVILTHAAGDDFEAALVAARLEALGYAVLFEPADEPSLSPMSRRKLESSIASADCVLVLWSRLAVLNPNLLDVATRAKAAGKLALARLDASTPPSRVGAGANLSNWIGRKDARGWRELAATIAAKAPMSKAAPAATSAPSASAKALGRETMAAAAPEEAATSSAKKGGGAAGALVALLVLLAAVGAGAYYFLMN